MTLNNLKRLFLIDGLGAIVSAILLGIVLVKLHPLFGIPIPTLYVLAALPCLFFVYDFCCYFLVEMNLGLFLKAIAIINLLYCCLSFGLAIYHHQELTLLGWAYILLEIVIVIILAIYELRVANDHIKND